MVIVAVSVMGRGRGGRREGGREGGKKEDE